MHDLVSFISLDVVLALICTAQNCLTLLMVFRFYLAVACVCPVLLLRSDLNSMRVRYVYVECIPVIERKVMAYAEVDAAYSAGWNCSFFYGICRNLKI